MIGGNRDPSNAVEVPGPGLHGARSLDRLDGGRLVRPGGGPRTFGCRRAADHRAGQPGPQPAQAVVNLAAETVRQAERQLAALWEAVQDAHAQALRTTAAEARHRQHGTSKPSTASHGQRSMRWPPSP